MHLKEGHIRGNKCKFATENETGIFKLVKI